MFAPIYIDVSDLASEFVMSEEEVRSLSRYILARVADEYVREWEHLIDQNLHSTRAEYKRGIFSEQPDDYNIIIGLTPRQSSLAMMLEDGASQFDMQEGFKKSAKAVQKKDGGWYLTVPFKFATSEAIGESGFSNKMPKPIEQLVKVMKEPLKLGNIPEALRSIGQNQTSGYKHKFNIYEGLQRKEVGSGQNEKRGGYMSFRRISDKSDKDAWQHPGFEALNLMDKAAQEIDIGRLVDSAVQEFLDDKR
jgi:hypothetical protein